MAFKLNIKEFDYKSFLLQYGEWVGVGVVGALALVVLVFGSVKMVSAGRPSKNAERVEDLAKKADQRIKDAPVPTDATQPPAEFQASLRLDPVDPSPYYTTRGIFVASTIEDTRRRKPEILPLAEEFSCQVVMTGALGAIIRATDDQHRQVWVLEGKEQDPRTRILNRRFQRMGPAFGAPGAGGGGRMRGGAGGGGAGFGGPGGMGMRQLNMQTTQGKWMDLDKVEDSTHLALQLYPVRMVVVSASFPLKEQLIEFRKKMRKRSLGELAAMIASGDAIWEFRKPEIERMKLTPDGKEVSGWEPYTDKIDEAIRSLLARAAERVPEDPLFEKHEGVINKGLTMPRPALARGQYPSENLPNIVNGIRALDRPERAQTAEKRHRSTASLKLQGLTNVWDPLDSTPVTEEDKKKKEEIAAQEKADLEQAKTAEDDDFDVPSHALFRFIDATVEPGYSYRYRIKIRMANPNFGKHNLAYPAIGQDEEISAPEWTRTPTVTMPNETDWYVMDEKPDKDKLVVQMHHWVDAVLTNPDDAHSQTPIGDWAIWDRALAHRGEYVGRIQDAELPTWKVEKEMYELAANTRSNSRRLPVDFTARVSRSADKEPVLLLDYSGGKAVAFHSGGKKMVDQVPVEVLILNPDGKLSIHKQSDDAAKPERAARYTEWFKWIVLVKMGRAGKPGDILQRQQMIPGRETGGGRRGL